MCRKRLPSLERGTRVASEVVSTWSRGQLPSWESDWDPGERCLLGVQSLCRARGWGVSSQGWSTPGRRPASRKDRVPPFPVGLAVPLWTFHEAQLQHHKATQRGWKSGLIGAERGYLVSRNRACLPFVLPSLLSAS